MVEHLISNQNVEGSTPFTRSETPVKSSPSPIIRGRMESPRQVVLNSLSENDIDDVMGWVNDPHVMGYFAAHQNTIGRDAELGYIRSLIASPTDHAFTVRDAETGAYVGQVSINKIDTTARNGRVFMTVTAAAQGHGYAPRMLAAVMAKGWELGLHKLWLIVREENIRSITAYENAGFVREGLLRDEYYVQGKFWNMVRMGCLNPSETTAVAGAGQSS